MPDRPADLAAIEAAVRRELAACVRDKHHPWRVAVLATTDGEQADARSIVLREYDDAVRTLLLFTDARSGKVQQLARHPGGTLVLWSAALGWQLRLRVTLQAQTEGPAVASRWARLKTSPAAQDYLSPLPPGSVIDSPAPEPGRQAHFAVVSAHITAMDWLELHPLGHRRAAFDDQGARWLTP